jgi:TRAP-type C4-dicarboxylate transport system permease small subunit
VASRLRNALLIIVFVLLLIWTTWPIISVALAGSIASANGCQLDEGSIHPCVVRGADMGETLYAMGVMGWFALVTVPTGGLGLLLLGVIVLIIWAAGRARRARGRDQETSPGQ